MVEQGLFRDADGTGSGWDRDVHDDDPATVHVVGLSILSGSHLPLVKDVVAGLRAAGLDDVPVVVGGIIPPEDAQALQQAGVAAVYTPKDFELNRIMADIVRIVDRTAA